MCQQKYPVVNNFGGQIFCGDNTIFWIKFHGVKSFGGQILGCRNGTVCIRYMGSGRPIYAIFTSSFMEIRGYSTNLAHCWAGSVKKLQVWSQIEFNSMWLQVTHWHFLNENVALSVYQWDSLTETDPVRLRLNICDWRWNSVMRDLI